MRNLLLVTCLIFSINSWGQISLGPSLYYGKSEIPNNIKSIRTSSDYTESRDSYVAGVFGEYKFNNWFAMQLDVLYDQINSEQFYFSDISNPMSYRSTLFNKVEYISLPLTMQFQFKKFNLNIGYQTSILLSNTYNSTIIYYGGNETKTSGKENDAFLKRNISFVASLSYNVYKNIYVEGKFTNGLTNIMNGQAGYTFDATTRQFLFGIYYLISFHKKETETPKTETKTENE